jgi:hypothetical protein
VDATRFTTSAGVSRVAGATAAMGEGGGACELASVAGGVNLGLMPTRSDDGGADDGECVQIRVDVGS